MLPVETPVTVPVLLTKAIAELLVLHVPPLLKSNNDVVEPEQIVVVPVIGLGADGIVFTVTFVVVIVEPHMLVIEYVMATLPAEIPVSVPVAASILAIEVLPLVQLPPVVASVRERTEPIQTVPVPKIDAGAEGTVITLIEAVVFALPQEFDIV